MDIKDKVRTAVLVVGMIVITVVAIYKNDIGTWLMSQLNVSHGSQIQQIFR